MTTAWVEPADVDVNGGWKNTNLIALVTALQAWFGNIDGVDFKWDLTMAGDIDGCGKDIYNVKKWLGPAAGDVQVRDASGFGMSPSNTATQNFAALQAAIDDLPNGVGGVVVIPPGVYLINFGLKMDGSATSGKDIPNVTLMGFGDCTTLKLARSITYGNVIDMGSQPNMTIRDLRYDGNGVVHTTTSTAVMADGTTNARIINVTFDNIRYTTGGSPDAISAYGALDLMVSDCRFDVDNCGVIAGTSGSGIVVEDSHFKVPHPTNTGGGCITIQTTIGWSISGCVFAGDGNAAMHDRYGVYGAASGTVTSRLGSITGNAFDRCTQGVGFLSSGGADPKPLDQFTTAGNTVRKCLEAGIRFRASFAGAPGLTTNYHSILGNALSKNGDYGISGAVTAGSYWHSTLSYSSIVGNTSINQGKAGIGFEGNTAYWEDDPGTYGNVVVGNACGDTRGAGADQDYGITLDGSSSSTAYDESVASSLVLANACSENTTSDFKDTGDSNSLAHNQET